MIHMVEASTFEVCEAIRQAAEAQGDESRLLVLLGVNNDLVSAEAKYHKAYYSSYVSKSYLKYIGFKEADAESINSKAFSELVSETYSQQG